MDMILEGVSLWRRSEREEVMLVSDQWGMGDILWKLIDSQFIF